jgi:hypothetical protein
MSPAKPKNQASAYNDDEDVSQGQTAWPFQVSRTGERAHPSRPVLSGPFLDRRLKRRSAEGAPHSPQWSSLQYACSQLRRSTALTRPAPVSHLTATATCAPQVELRVESGEDSDGPLASRLIGSPSANVWLKNMDHPSLSLHANMYCRRSYHIQDCRLTLGKKR